MKAKRRDERLVLADHFARVARATDAKMLAARHRFSLAALACLRGALDAEQQVRAALAEIDAARAALRVVNDA